MLRPAQPSGPSHDEMAVRDPEALAARCAEVEGLLADLVMSADAASFRAARLWLIQHGLVEVFARSEIYPQDPS